MPFREGDTCPRCGDGKLVKKTGKYGEFLGCDLYYHTLCNFVAKLPKEENSLENQADEFLAQHGIKVLKI